MTGKVHESGFLRQLSSGTMVSLLPPYKLHGNQEVVIGRDPSCQIILDSTEYGMVSRRHVAIRPFSGAGKNSGWEISDLNSANGTYVNGCLLKGWQILQVGDRIILGKGGVEFIFECPVSFNPTLQTPSLVTSVAPVPSPLPLDSVSFTQLFPIFSTGGDLRTKAYLIPGMITVTFVVLMFAAVGEPVFFNLILAAYLAGAAYYFVYQLCGKHKPWWVLLGSAGATILILLSPLLPVFIAVFRGILPGQLPAETESVSFPILLIRMFFGAGLMEELIKALPVLFAYFVGRLLHSPWRERIGVWEPLDGILLGTASAVGFTLLETLGQYVPEIARQVSSEAALQLLIPRILGSIAGHMAYSGYLGYFIGLSALKPRKRWQILAVGYFTAAGLHALWNTTGFFNGLLLPVVGVVSYAFLTAAILKARVLSPNRAQNFATRLKGF